MSENQELLEHLLENHTGQHNAITQSKLAKKMDMNTSTLRSELRRLREERNIPIGNMRDGYFLIQDREELQDFVGHVNSEIQSKKNTIEHTLEAFESFDGDVSDVEDTAETIGKTYDCAKCGSDIPKADRRYPKQGEYEDKPVCKPCMGNLLMNR
jgi:hypothetical protein